MFTTMGTKPEEGMMRQLERRAQVISRCTFATMGTKPGERVMGQLERRAEAISGEFNSQDIANTVWAICCFFLQFNLSLRYLLFLVFQLTVKDFDDQKRVVSCTSFSSRATC